MAAADGVEIKDVLIQIRDQVPGVGAEAQQVQGVAAHNAGAVGNPVQMGGVDVDGFIRRLRVDASGGLWLARNDRATGDGLGDSTAVVSSGSNDLIRFVTVGFGFNGASWDRIRVANVYKPFSVQVPVANTKLWDPAPGKKFRLMGCVLASVAGGQIELLDEATPFLKVGVVAGVSVSYDLGQGYLSLAVGNAVYINAPDDAYGLLWGTEE